MECNHADGTGRSQSEDVTKTQRTAVRDERSRYGIPRTIYLDIVSEVGRNRC